MKYGVVIFPGSNCDRDMVNALRELKHEVITIWHKDSDISAFQKEDCIVLPGGFSFGDYLRCGSIARFSPVMQSVIQFAKNGGRVLGICNGYQILCESGLLPGVLLPNSGNRFVCKNIYLHSEKTGKVFMIPVAHGDGRYFINPEGLARLKENDQILLRYCGPSGEIDERFTPNGSLDNIAAICNKEGNVIGMMPHPERACDPLLGNTQGRALLDELVPAEQLETV